MIRLSDSDLLPEAWEGTAVSIGAFDGVHLGHRALIGEMRSRAEVDGLASVVITFDRHPASMVRPSSAPRLLTDLDQKIELLASTGADAVLVVTFDQGRATQSPEGFVSEVLVGMLRARLVVVGRDFHFGKERRGDVELLVEMGRIHGFAVESVELMPGTTRTSSDGVVMGDVVAEPISSTRIRKLLEQSRVEAAAALLGRDHEVRGTVVRGDGRGVELGCPTANLAVDEEILLPADGIYAGWAVLPDRSTRGMVASVGKRPTYYRQATTSITEVHVLDFDGDLYGSTLAARFHRRLRGEVAFGSEDELVAQIRLDVDAARRALGERVDPPSVSPEP